MSYIINKLLELDETFNIALKDVKKLKNLTSEELLKLYGLYKQAIFGKNTTDKPSMFISYRALKKWSAWTEVSELTKDEAKEMYIKLVNQLIKLYG